VPDEDRHTYEERLRRGGVLLTADVDDGKTAAAVAALDNSNSIDLDARAQEWRSDGWDYAGTATEEGGEADEYFPYGARNVEQGSPRFRSYYTADRERS
jgi:hypothetical protein